MTLVSLAQPFVWPVAFLHTSTPGVITMVTLDAAGEYASFIFQAWKDMTISHIGFRTGAVSGSPTANVRIETVGTDGNPSGTLWATNTNIVTGTLVANTWALHALTASASITRGQLVAVKIAYNSGTSFVVQQLTGTLLSLMPSLSYRVLNSGTPTQSVHSGLALVAVGSATNSFYPIPGMFPLTAVASTDFASSSSPNRYGIRFQLPFKAQLLAITFVSNLLGDFDIGIYNDAGTLLDGTSFDGDVFHDGQPFQFDTPQTLNKNTWYRATVEATTATTQEVFTMTLPSSDYVSASPYGSFGHLTTFTSPNWDDTNTTIVPMMQLSLLQVDDGDGAGGGGASAYTFA
jgi:hypothetical protein